MNCHDATSVVFVDQKVLVAENVDQNPTQTIVFGVLTKSGTRSLNRVRFMVKRDLTVHGWTHEQIDKSKDFKDGFTLQQVIGTSEGYQLYKDSKPVTYQLCLI